jgi:hypothetical protein
MAKRGSFDDDDDFLDEEIADWDDDDENLDDVDDEVDDDVDDDEEESVDDVEDASDEDDANATDVESEDEPPKAKPTARGRRRPRAIDADAASAENEVEEPLRSDSEVAEEAIIEEEVVYPPDDEKALAALKKLRVRLDVNDKGNVWRVIFDDTNGKDPSLVLLKGLPALKELWLLGTKVTEKATAAFKEEHPKVKVYA